HLPVSALSSPPPPPPPFPYTTLFRSPVPLGPPWRRCPCACLRGVSATRRARPQTKSPTNDKPRARRAKRAAQRRGARQQAGPAQGPHAARWGGRPRGLVVAGGVAREATSAPHAHVDEMDCRSVAAADVWATARIAHTLPAPAGQAVTGMRGRSSHG